MNRARTISLGLVLAAAAAASVAMMRGSGFRPQGKALEFVRAPTSRFSSTPAAADGTRVFAAAAPARMSTVVSLGKDSHGRHLSVREYDECPPEGHSTHGGPCAVYTTDVGISISHDLDSPCAHGFARFSDKCDAVVLATLANLVTVVFDGGDHVLPELAPARTP